LLVEYVKEPTLFPGVIVSPSGIVATVVYNCTQVGKANITIDLTLDNRFMELHFAWLKRVGGTA